MIRIVKIIAVFLLLVFSGVAQAQKPYRVGTTSANFLEIGYGSAGIAMGDAYVSLVRDVSSLYWNPSGLGYMKKHEFQVMYQPWIADINNSYVGLGLVHPRLGTFALGFIGVHYGAEKVTSVLMQEGTGEEFDGQEFSFSLSYGRKLAQWFSFGVGGKYIASRIWHESASAVAFDLGATVNTSFLSPTGMPDEGLTIGMSISNYGTRLKYDGIDLKQTLDIASEEEGNFKYIPVRYELQGWELPLIFRIGISAHPILSSYQRLTLAVDALHPNNNSEYLNLGGQYALIVPRLGTIFLRAGYKGFQMVDSEYGLTFGFGLLLYVMNNNALKLDYAFRDIGVLGKMHSYTLSLTF
ncbi:MAG: PorV/PorQ family protein [candidate division KSB1 bacterium]|nr:PorV/PorQ family protein [candidate division KSB1 bacterium]